MKGMYPTAEQAQGGGGTRPNRMKQPSGMGSNEHHKGTMSGGDTTRHKGTMGESKSKPKCKGTMGSGGM